MRLLWKFDLVRLISDSRLASHSSEPGCGYTLDSIVRCKFGGTANDCDIAETVADLQKYGAAGYLHYDGERWHTTDRGEAFVRRFRRGRWACSGCGSTDLEVAAHDARAFGTIDHGTADNPWQLAVVDEVEVEGGVVLCPTCGGEVNVCRILAERAAA